MAGYKVRWNRESAESYNTVVLACEEGVKRSREDWYFGIFYCIARFVKGNVLLLPLTTPHYTINNPKELSEGKKSQQPSPNPSLFCLSRGIIV